LLGAGYIDEKCFPIGKHTCVNYVPNTLKQHFKCPGVLAGFLIHRVTNRLLVRLGVTEHVNTVVLIGIIEWHMMNSVSRLLYVNVEIPIFHPFKHKFMITGFGPYDIPVVFRI